MTKNYEIISQFVPKNDANFAIADVNHLKGGYIQVSTTEEMQSYLAYTNRLKEGMLCFVTETKLFYQLINNKWKKWTIGTGGSSMSLQSVETLEDLNNTTLEVQGQIVYIDDIDELRYYNGTIWKSFNKIYVSETPPSDTGGIWIDISEEKDYTKSNAIIQSLVATVAALANKVAKLEYMSHEIDPGDITNNMYAVYKDYTAEEPDYSDDLDELENQLVTESYGTSVQSDKEETTILDSIPIVESPEPTYSPTPNTCHLLCKWAETYNVMYNNWDNVLPRELVYCAGNKTLYIKDPNTNGMIVIGSSTGGGTINPNIDDIMNGIIQNSAKTLINGIKFVDIVHPSKSYLFQVENGEMKLQDQSTNSYANSQTFAEDVVVDATNNIKVSYYSTPYFPGVQDWEYNGNTALYNALLFIGTVYSAGNSASSTDYNPCDYDFIELINTSLHDICLGGLYLHYSEGIASGRRQWLTLPLSGTIKAGSTYLIKGAKCGDSTYALIKVGEPDLYWSKENTLNNTDIFEDSTTNYSIWDSDGMLKINNDCCFYLSGAIKYSNSDTATLDFSTTTLQLSEPWKNSEVSYGFIDLAGFSTSSAVASLNGKAPSLDKNKLFVRYYYLDIALQAYKSQCASPDTNTKAFTYIDLVNYDQRLNPIKYAPKNSKEGKTIFTNKHLIEGSVPTFVTCTFGYNPHTTRCFTWVNTGYRDEYLQYRKQGSDTWIQVESFKANDGRTSTKNWNNSIYDRIRTTSTDGTKFTVHKCIIDLYNWEGDGPDSTEIYEYRVGYNNNWTDIKTFTLRNRQDIINNGFSFVQVTDQQGFIAEEYETWRLCAEYINKNESDIQFTINTGDATQNGNRVNEWVDYFKAGESLFNHLEQQYTVGNNDLCPTIPYKFGKGSDVTKVNPINVQYFFTYEHPYTIPTSASGIYIPCVYSYVYGNTYFLCMNSELTDKTEGEISASTALFGQQTVYLYQSIKTWAQADIDRLPNTINWKIAYCHESPFTILIKSVVTKYIEAKSKNSEDLVTLKTHRGDVTSHLNNPGGWWFAPFLEDNHFNLCLCGHKHTFSNSYYLHDNADNRMEPYVYEKAITYTTVRNEEGVETQEADNTSIYDSKENLNTSINTDTGKNTCTITNDMTKWYVKYVMCQASGYKLISNKEIPYENVGWVEECYGTPNSNKNDDNAKTTQQFPHYIIWNIGKGTEKENPESSLTEAEERIFGKAKKLKITSSGKKAIYNYNTSQLKVDQLSAVGGNGVSNSGNNNIIVRHINWCETTE